MAEEGREKTIGRREGDERDNVNAPGLNFCLGVHDTEGAMNCGFAAVLVGISTRASADPYQNGGSSSSMRFLFFDISYHGLMHDFSSSFLCFTRGQAYIG